MLLENTDNEYSNWSIAPASKELVLMAEEWTRIRRKNYGAIEPTVVDL